MFQAPKGTRDFMPREMAKRRYYFEKIRKVLENFGYGEVQTPAFESIELLEAKGGIGGEAVKDVFRIWDKGKGKLGYGLIFDPTTPIARIVANDKSLKFPVKWYYIRPMWRYEEVKRGRYREFWQAGAELIGSADPVSDAEILALTYFCMKALGIKEFTLRVNSRKIMERLAEVAGIPRNKWVDAFRAIDKLDKVGEKNVKGELERFGIPEQAIKKFLKYVKMEKESLVKELKDYKDAIEELNEVEKILKYAKMMGVDNAKLDFSIIRGLEYYTGFIFETLVKGNERLGSVASGGRYDKLIEIYGGKPTPATGVGIGLDRLMEILPDLKDYFQARVFVAGVNESMRDNVIEIASKLRRFGTPTDFDCLGRPLKKQLEYASALRVPFVIIVGPEEIRKGEVKVRDMRSGKEKYVPINRITEEFSY